MSESNDKALIEALLHAAHRFKWVNELGMPICKFPVDRAIHPHATHLVIRLITSPEIELWYANLDHSLSVSRQDIWSGPRITVSDPRLDILFIHAKNQIASTLPDAMAADLTRR